MDSCDFSFRGETLSNHGYILCSFDGADSASTITTDSQKEFTTIAMFGGKYYPILCYTYNNALVMEMDIFKPSDDDGVGSISPTESAQIKRWLGCHTPKELIFLDDDYNGYHWNGVFNVEEVRANSVIVGFHLTFQCTAPFGYKDKVVISGEVAANGVVTVNDTSDEEGHIYPDITIIPLASGKLTITNSFDGREMVINNCIVDETITITRLLQITSTNNSHEVENDFNYKFLRINNEYGDTKNELTFSLPCSYSISYNPIAKVVVA